MSDSLFSELPASVKPQDMRRIGEALAQPDCTLEVAMAAGGLEAWETDPWVPPALLQVELLPRNVIDPCVGKGAWTIALRLAGYEVETVDIVDWSRHFAEADAPDHVADFLSIDPERLDACRLAGRDGFAVVMNPPFSGHDGLLSCAFVDKALRMGARKVVCFQRFAWREAGKRHGWWAANPPARVWLCVDRATCWRFDVPHGCNGTCEKHINRYERDDRRQQGLVNGCRACIGNTPTAHAVYVWERGHKGAEMMHALRRAV